MIVIHTDTTFRRLLSGTMFFLALTLVLSPAFAQTSGSLVINTDYEIEQNYDTVTINGNPVVEGNADIGVLLTLENDSGEGKRNTFTRTGLLTQTGGTFNNNGNMIADAIIVNGTFYNSASDSYKKSVVHMTVFNGSVTNDGRIGIYNTGLNDRYGGLSQFGGEVINNNSISISDIHGGLLINNRRANTVNLFGGEVISKDFIETATVRGGKLTNTYYMKEDGEPSGGSVENLTLLDGGHVENRHRVNNLVMSGGLFEHYADEENVKASLNESYFLQSANISGGTFIGNGNVIEMVLDTVLDTNLFTGHIQTLIMDENAALKFAVSTLEDFDKLRLGSINGSAKFFVDFGDFFSDNDWGFFDLKQLFVFDNPEGQWDDRDDWNQFQLSGLETGSYSVGDNGVVWQVSSKGQFTSNPEPATFAILGLAFAGAGFAARRRIKK